MRPRHRSNLQQTEEKAILARLMWHFGLPQRIIAHALGVERSTVCYYVSPKCKAAYRAGIA